MKLDKVRAAEILREQAAHLTSNKGDEAWIAKVERLSQLCQDGLSKTHIAFLGTAMLAKALDLRADLFAIKPNHAKDNENAFSARTLCHSVLVPLAAELGISLGVTGREPLNNQPYFRMTRLGDGTPVHGGGRAAFDYMLELVHELETLKTETGALGTLRAYIGVRMKYQPRYAVREGTTQITPESLTTTIREFVRLNSEHGKRAQAIVAGLLDVFATPADASTTQAANIQAMSACVPKPTQMNGTRPSKYATSPSLFPTRKSSARSALTCRCARLP